MGYRRSIGQSGSITLTRSLLLEKLGFQEGDVFQILRHDDDLILRKVESHFTSFLISRQILYLSQSSQSLREL